MGSIDSEDVWCLGSHGVLVLSLTSQSYYQLGIVGSRSSRKYAERYTVCLNTLDHKSKAFSRARELFQLWDERRSAQGDMPWEVIISAPDGALLLNALQTPSEITVRPQEASHSDIHIPTPNLTKLRLPMKGNTGDNELLEEWCESVSELFEWTGMVSIGSERLKASDRVDSYVAVYDPSFPTKYVGDVTHFRWHGFLAPALVESVIGNVLNSLQKMEHASYISITANTYSGSPITWLSSKITATSTANELTPLLTKVIHCWSLIIDSQDGNLNWISATTESSR